MGGTGALSILPLSVFRDIIILYGGNPRIHLARIWDNPSTVITSQSRGPRKKGEPGCPVKAVARQKNNYPAEKWSPDRNFQDRGFGDSVLSTDINQSDRGVNS